MTVFDRAALLERLEGDEGFLRELAGLFLEEVPGTLDQLREAVRGGDPEAIRLAAHALKGAAANVSGEELARLARSAERAGAEGDVAAARGCLGPIEAAMDRLVAALNAEIEGGGRV